MKHWCLAAALLLCIAWAYTAMADYPAVRIDPATGKPYDFGGETFYLYDWYSGDGGRVTEPDEKTQALYDYQDWLMETYHFTLVSKQKGDWSTQVQELAKIAYAPTGEKCLFLLPGSLMSEAVKKGVISDWSNTGVDLTDDKWNTSSTQLMSYNGGVYGTSVGKSEPRHCLFFNKRLLKEAGIDSDTIYDLQASGEWTWKAFESMLSRTQRDLDNDGKVDVYALTGLSDDMFTIAVASNGGAFFSTDGDGKLQVSADRPEATEALQWAKRIWNVYHRPQKDFDNWDYYKEVFANGEAVFYVGQAWSGFNYNSELSQMQDAWGCVAFPIGPMGSTYVTTVNNNMTVIPKAYDEDTTAKIAIIYDLWTSPVPGYEEDNLVEDMSSYITDERALETYAMLREKDHNVSDKSTLLGDTKMILGVNLLWQLPSEELDNVYENALPAWQQACDQFNSGAYEEGPGKEEPTDEEITGEWVVGEYGNHRFLKDDGTYATGVCTILGNKYLFEMDGFLVRSWFCLIDDQLYAADKNGVLLRGICPFEMGIGYFDEETGVFQYCIQHPYSFMEEMSRPATADTAGVTQGFVCMLCETVLRPVEILPSETVILPPDLRVVEENSFAGVAMKQVTIPKSVERIEAGAFVNCPNLRFVYISGSCEIEDGAFDANEDLEFLVWPSSGLEQWAYQHHYRPVPNWWEDPN